MLLRIKQSIDCTVNKWITSNVENSPKVYSNIINPDFDKPTDWNKVRALRIYKTVPDRSSYAAHTHRISDTIVDLKFQKKTSEEIILILKSLKEIYDKYEGFEFTFDVEALNSSVSKWLQSQIENISTDKNKNKTLTEIWKVDISEMNVILEKLKDDEFFTKNTSGQYKYAGENLTLFAAFAYVLHIRHKTLGKWCRGKAQIIYNEFFDTPFTDKEYEPFKLNKVKQGFKRHWKYFSCIKKYSPVK